MPKDEKKLELIKKHYALCDNESDNRAREAWIEDMRFTHVPGYQWPQEMRRTREGDPTSPRPCLEINQVAQHVYQVTNDLRQNRPTAKVRPVSMNASKDTAEIYDGIIRHIASCSDSEVVVDVAANHAATGGFGYMRLITKVIDEETNEQEIYEEPVYNPLSVRIDPNAKHPAAADAEWAFVIDDMPRERYEAKYGKESFQGQWQETSTGGYVGWVTKDTVRIAEYFSKTTRETNVLVLLNGREIEEEMYWKQYGGEVMRPPVIKTRKKTCNYVKWCKVTSFEILEEGEFPSEYIPLIRVPGIYTDIEGERYWKGLIRDAKDSQRSYNYWWSCYTETVALQPKVPWLVAEGQVDGYESEWNRANTSNITYLTYRVVDEQGQPLPPPTRQQLQGVPQGIMQGLMVASDAIKSTTGQFNASMGQRDNETSGKAIVARQREGDVATYHFPDNVALAVRHKARILIDMIPRVYDTKRIIRILGEDDETGEARIDPTQAEAVREFTDQNGDIQKIYNLNVGKYDVVATIGPSYTTKRQEAVEAMSQIMQGNPAIFQAIGDIWVDVQDWPGSDRVKDRLKLFLPPQVQQAEAKENKIPPEMQAQMQAMQQQMQQMQQMLQQAQIEMQKLQAEKMSKAADIQIKQIELQMKQMELQSTQIEAETKRYEASAKVEEAHAENIRSAAAVVQPSAADNMGAIG